MKTLLVLLTVLLLALGAAGPAHAGNGLDAQARGLFQNVMTNSTSPGVVSGARRGEIFGGSFEARNKIMNLNLVSFAPPSISAGCNGINAFMGSFSFISTAQLVAALRSVATAAIGYAFRLALGSMCPMCEKIMAALQAVMNAVNNGDRNTCQIAQGLLTLGGSSSIAATIQNAGESFAEDTGQKNDHFDAEMNDAADSITSWLNKFDGPHLAELQPGNLMWEALSDENVAAWSVSPAPGYDDNTYLEDIISLTGTVVICESTDKNCGGASASTPNTGSGTTSGAPASEAVGPAGGEIGRYYPPLIELKDLILGDTAGHSVWVWRCTQGPSGPKGGAFGPDGCTTMSGQQSGSFTGMLGSVCTVLLGNATCAADQYPVDNTLGSNNGIINDLVAGNSPTQDEQAMLEFGGAPVQHAIRLALMAGPAIGGAYLENHIKAIALQMSYNLAQADIKMAEVSLGQHTKPHQNYGKFQDKLHQRDARITQEFVAMTKLPGYSVSSLLPDYNAAMAAATPVSDPVGQRTLH